MANDASFAQVIADFAPKLADLTDNLVLGESGNAPVFPSGIVA